MKKELIDECECPSCGTKLGNLTVKTRGVKTIFPSVVRGFSKSGGYIPASGNYAGHDVFVIVMTTKNGK